MLDVKLSDICAACHRKTPRSVRVCETGSAELHAVLIQAETGWFSVLQVVARQQCED